MCFNGKKIHLIDDIQTIIYSVHNNIAKCEILCEDLSLKPCYVAKVGNFFAHGETAREALLYAQKKYDDNLPTEEKIRIFIEKYPELNTYVAASELFNEHNFLTGSCEIGRRQFCKNNNIDLKNDQFTVEEFIELTINAYRGDVIKKLKEEYQKQNNHV